MTIVGPEMDTIFKNFKDRATLDDTKTVCLWSDFWVFIRVFFEFVLEPLEHGRRWGLVCACCKHLRDLGKRNINCVRASRRLDEARGFIAIIKSQLEANLARLTIDTCEGIQWVYQEVSLALRKLIPLHVAKFSWLNSVPYLFARAHVVEDARIIVDQLTGTPIEFLDALSLRWRNTLLPDLQMVIDGHGVSPQLQSAADVIQVWTKQ